MYGSPASRSFTTADSHRARAELGRGDAVMFAKGGRKVAPAGVPGPCGHLIDRRRPVLPKEMGCVLHPHVLHQRHRRFSKGAGKSFCKRGPTHRRRISETLDRMVG